MRQFDVFKNPNPRSAKDVPLLLLVQHSLLEVLDTRLMVPLVPLSAVGKRPITRLNPTLRVKGDTYVLLAQQLGTVRTGSLGRAIENIDQQRDLVLAAIDVVLSGL